MSRSSDVDCHVHLACRAEQGLFELVFLADEVTLRQRDEPAGSLFRTNLAGAPDPAKMPPGLATGELTSIILCADR